MMKPAAARVEPFTALSGANGLGSQGRGHTAQTPALTPEQAQALNRASWMTAIGEGAAAMKRSMGGSSSGMPGFKRAQPGSEQDGGPQPFDNGSFDGETRESAAPAAAALAASQPRPGSGSGGMSLG